MNSRKSMFYTDDQGRIRYIGGKDKKAQGTARVRDVQTVPIRKKAGYFFTNAEGKVVFTGGPSAGSGTASVGIQQKMPVLYDKDFMIKSLKPIDIASKEDLGQIYTALNDTIKVTGYDMSDNLLFVPAKPMMGDNIGISTKGAYGDSKGKRIIALSPSALDNAIEKHGLSVMAEWNGLPADSTRNDLLRVITAHEVGHSWKRQHPEIEERWNKLSINNMVSDYSRYYNSHDENFAVAFALFTQGYDLPSAVENFFLEVTQ